MELILFLPIASFWPITTSVFDYNSNIIIMIYFFSIVFVSYIKHSKHANMLLVALISTARAVFSTKSSVPVLISTIYQHQELHLHNLEIPHYVRRCLRVQNYMHKWHRDVQKWVPPLSTIVYHERRSNPDGLFRQNLNVTGTGTGSLTDGMLNL